MVEQNCLTRLKALLERHFRAPLEKLEAISKGVLDSYLSPHRRYHGLGHIQQCLRELDRLPPLPVDRELIELALWYHDVVYVPGGTQDNEGLSAQWLRSDLGRLEGDLDLVKAEEMIYLSKHNQAPVEDLTIQVFLDIDMSILGQPERIYREYMKKVREEYHQVPLFIFRERRNKFLKRLLKEGIYYSPYFIERYEEAATRNIRAELQKSILLQP